MCSEGFNPHTALLVFQGKMTSASSSLGSLNSLQCVSSCSIASYSPSEGQQEEGQSSLQDLSYRKASSWASLKAKRRTKHVTRNITPHRRQRLRQLISREKTLQGILRMILSSATLLSPPHASRKAPYDTSTGVLSAPAGITSSSGRIMAHLNQEARQDTMKAETELTPASAPPGTLCPVDRPQQHLTAGDVPQSRILRNAFSVDIGCQTAGPHLINQGVTEVCPEVVRDQTAPQNAAVEAEGENLAGLEKRFQALKQQLEQQQMMCLVQHFRIIQITKEAEEEAEEQAESLAAVEVTAISLQEQLAEERDKNRRLEAEAESLRQVVAELRKDNRGGNNSIKKAIMQFDDWDVICGSSRVVAAGEERSSGTAALRRKTCDINCSVTQQQQQQYAFPASRRPSQLTLDLAQSQYS
ncbi:hypothetical protein CEUSTIGMA_g11064.t1 [Chlamydomonas eustigma]|uniref:Uncharacterized protein n=1 Tax=Chlamydomonas eustigma TaxID=1157962 RepID=A0A250XLH9_9CHLO|nr:hypothetical protein CEUSTIGMA_g11064.t1 [Chlamydomonas eustigma]|eukprot:GAX83640.1 hypothetical protein CEUSTIGMA_g11064.t1 [Chlamydomonas eustigma]